MNWKILGLLAGMYLTYGYYNASEGGRRSPDLNQIVMGPIVDLFLFVMDMWYGIKRDANGRRLD